MPTSMQAGDELAGRYRLEDLLAENGSGRFWRAHDLVLHRAVAIHVLSADDERAEAVLAAARAAGPVINRRLLRVLDAEVSDGRCYVVNEWGQGDSLDILLTREGPLPPRRAAWLVSEVADGIAEAHAAGLAHGRLTPENVLLDQHGQIRIIGFGVDAALHGLPPGRTGVDEIDLAGLLYCALTGTWAGASESAVPPAPEVHGEVLRPRRVRAGIPRVLDALCDQVLNPQHTPGPASVDHSARRICEQLQAYVGDVTGTQVAVQPVRPPTTAVPTASTAPTAIAAPTPAPDPVTEVQPVAEPAVEPVTEPLSERVSAPVGEPEVEPESPSDDDPAAPDLPTQAGMPVFHDDDEVDWLRARTDRPEPPPPLEAPAPKPLFAPDPPVGEPVRRPRPGSRAASGNPDYWPWDVSQDHSPHHDSGVQPVGRDTGSWSSGAWPGDQWGTDDDLDDTGNQVPGRSWIRLAMIVGGCVLVMVAAVAAYQLGLPTVTEPSSDEPTTTTTPSVAAPTPFPDLVADDFDPQGSEPREENPESVPNVVDGDPATSWSTSTYEQNFGPAGLKTGVGLVVDLGATRGVREVVVTVDGGETSLAAYVTSATPTGVAGLTPVGTASGSGELAIALDEAVSGRYVTLWLTLLPPVDGGFRGTIAEVQVLG